MNKKLLNEFLNGDIVIKCKSKEQKEFLKLVKSKNISWDDVSQITDSDIKNWLIKEDVIFKCNKRKYLSYGWTFIFQGDKVITYSELMEDKNIFEGWQLAKAIKEGKIKEGTKLKDNEGIEVRTEVYRGTKQLTICDSLNPQLQIPIFLLINRTFTLVAEPKEYVTFDEARCSKKKIKHKVWKNFYTLSDALKHLSCFCDEYINKMLSERAWEVAE